MVAVNHATKIDSAHLASFTLSSESNVRPSLKKSFLQRLTLMFRKLKRAPRRPPHTAIKAKIGISNKRYGCTTKLPNVMRPGSFTASISPLCADIKMFTVNVLIIAVKKTPHVKGKDQNEDASSREKSTPPIGAPNAAATPAAAPLLTKLRRSKSLRNILAR